jgi:hypothetical protein
MTKNRKIKKNQWNQKLVLWEQQYDQERDKTQITDIRNDTEIHEIHTP